MYLASVLIITYNQEQFIGQAIESVLAQKTDFDFEILIGDDFSDDSTAEIALSYSERFSNVRVIKRDKNLGASRNLYELLIQSKGEYIALLEGDDYWNSDNKLQTQVRFLQNNPDYVGCSCRVKVVDKQGNLYRRQNINWVRYKQSFSFSDFKGLYLPGQTGSMVYRRLDFSDEYFESIYKVHRNISDRTLVMLYLLKGNIHCINEIMSSYRMDADNQGVTKTFATDGVLINYELVQALSNIASNYKNKKVNFTHFRLVLMGKAALKSIFDSNSRRTLKYIMSDMGRFRFIVLCPVSVILCLFSKLNEKLHDLLKNQY